MRVLITGGAGFVASSLCRYFRTLNSPVDVVALDNLRRRGSESNILPLRQLGVTFIHGDIRNPSDLEDLSGPFDLMIEASAEPSVHAGTGHQSPKYVLDSNLTGTLNCLEFARRRCGGVVFLSTSRVYAIPALRNIPLRESPTRFELGDISGIRGLAPEGINEDFPMIGSGYRSFYGSSKLASELLVEEYAVNYKLPAVINRCSVIAGPGQFGKTDQGIFTLWVAKHLMNSTLAYTGFGGQGKQVRDLLHPQDLFRLIQLQLPHLSALSGQTFSVGGGTTRSVSLSEYTAICQEITGQTIPIHPIKETAEVDIPYFVTDATRVKERFGWRPDIAPRQIVQEIAAWIRANEQMLRPIFIS